MFKSAHLKVSAVWITLVVSYEVFCNVKVTTFTSNVERSATVRCGSFWTAILIFDEVLGNVQVSMLTCNMQESEA